MNSPARCFVKMYGITQADIPITTTATISTVSGFSHLPHPQIAGEKRPQDPGVLRPHAEFSSESSGAANPRWLWFSASSAKIATDKGPLPAIQRLSVSLAMRRMFDWPAEVFDPPNNSWLAGEFAQPGKFEAASMGKP